MRCVLVSEIRKWSIAGKNLGRTKSELMFMQTCQYGSWLEMVDILRPAKCQFLHHKNSYLKLGPFKEELHSDKPYIVVFHDLLSNTEVEYLKEVAKPNLSRNRTYNGGLSGAVNYQEIKSGKARKHIHKSVQAWISEVEWPTLSSIKNWVGKDYTYMIHPILWKLNQRISLATQLVTNVHGSTSKLQVTNYGLAGICETHVDSMGIMEVDEDHLRKTRPDFFVHGDVIATIMAWLSDTKAGGATAFVSPGHERTILPEKGSAAFWYNLYSDGMVDKSTKHGGCPILKGSKWILNRWIHSYDSFKNFPCHLKTFSRFKPPKSDCYHQTPISQR